jgi:hypothetical protein
VLAKNEWTKFNDILFNAIGQSYFDEMKFRPDAKTLIKFRQHLDCHFDWAWYIWNKNSIPKTTYEAEDVKPEKQIRTTRQEEFKDEIYQKWRSKYNNKNLVSIPGSLEKRRLARKKSFTSRRRLLLSRNTDGETISQYGTLVGTVNWDTVSKVNQREYESMVKSMKESTNASPALCKELVRLWEAQYAKMNGVTQADFMKWNRSGDLVTVQHYLYYEGYTKTICQLTSDSKDFLISKLYSIAEVLPEIFAGKTFKMFTKDDYSNTPLIATLLAISNFFGESLDFHVSLRSDVNTTEQITAAVSKNPLCNVILNYHYFNTAAVKRFGVATQGVPFITNLSEEEVSFLNSFVVPHKHSQRQI